MKNQQAALNFTGRPGNGWLMPTNAEDQPFSGLVSGPLYLENDMQVRVAAQYNEAANEFYAIVQTFDTKETLGAFTITPPRASTKRREARIVLPKIGTFNATVSREPTGSGRACYRIRIPSLFAPSAQLP